jgi:protein-L-isoaspartate(D-aspartate) O-methyltransferase
MPGYQHYAAARQNMVESQLRPNKVLDEAILNAFATLPREQFVPASQQALAYGDEDLPLGEGRTLLEPMVQARLLQAANLSRPCKVLEVGCGTGYGTAILAMLVADVYALDAHPQFCQQALANLTSLQLKARVNSGAHALGWSAAAPFDVIILQGAVQFLPEPIIKQLADGGRLVCVMRENAKVMGQARLYEKHHGQLSGRDLFDAATPYLNGFMAKPEFVF